MVKQTGIGVYRLWLEAAGKREKQEQRVFLSLLFLFRGEKGVGGMRED
jgi:hypothetical protein